MADNFINIKQVDDFGNLTDLTIYEFDTDLKLQAIVSAKTAVFISNAWRLTDVSRLHFRD